jgi:hypothetical protein
MRLLWGVWAGVAVLWIAFLVLLQMPEDLDGCPLPRGYGVPLAAEWGWFPPGLTCSYLPDGHTSDADLVRIPPSAGEALFAVVVLAFPAVVLAVDRGRRGRRRTV